MQKQWFRLDTAALIFPATVKKHWCNVFRLSATLTEPVDPDLLRQAAEDMQERFPHLYVRLGTGAFWYYLACGAMPAVQEDYAYPLTFMDKKERHRCCMRILYYDRRIAVEFFHALTDGFGGNVYLKSLLARYIFLKYGIEVAPDGEIRFCGSPASPEELEDSFPKNSAWRGAGRKEETAYRLSGTPEHSFLHLVTGTLDTDALRRLSAGYGCTVTTLLAAILAEAVIGMQTDAVPLYRQKPVKITIPVNLRKLYHSKSLRNFVLTLNIGVDPRRGRYSLEDLCHAIGHQLAAEATPQNMAAKIAANVLPQKSLLIRLFPLPVKNFVMKRIYAAIGEKKGCLNLSNLGTVTLPEEMATYVERMEFIIGVQQSYPNNCSVISYGEKTVISMIRNIRESELERRFFSRLVELGVSVDIESNERNMPCTV